MIKTFLKQKLVYLVLSGIGILLIVLALSQLSGNVLIAICFFGALIMGFGFFKTIKTEAIEGALNKDKLQRIANEYDNLKEAHLKLLSENQALSDMQINVSNIKPLVEIGLFEAETEFTQFVDQYFDENFNEIYHPEKINLIKATPAIYAERFVDNPIRISGALHFKIDAIYGIKVEEISVKTYENNNMPVVEIYGARPRFLSFKSRTVAWKNPLALKYSSPLLGKESWKTDNKLLEPFNNYIENYRENVIRASEKGPKELEWIKKPLEGQIKSMLSMLFFKGYIMHFVDHKTDDFISLNQFANSKLITPMAHEALTQYSEAGKT